MASKAKPKVAQKKVVKKAVPATKPKKIREYSRLDLIVLGDKTLNIDLEKILISRSKKLKTSLSGTSWSWGQGKGEIRVRIRFDNISGHTSVLKNCNLKPEHEGIIREIATELCAKYDLKIRGEIPEGNSLTMILDPQQSSEIITQKAKVDKIAKPKPIRKEKAKSASYLEKVAREASMTEFDSSEKEEPKSKPDASSEDDKTFSD